MKDFLPITKEDMIKRGWQQADFVYVIGDAYVDHSSFGTAIISRVLEEFLKRMRAGKGTRYIILPVFLAFYCLQFSYLFFLAIPSISISS